MSTLDPLRETQALIELAIAEIGLPAELLIIDKVHPHRTRDWRFDFAIPELQLAVEYEGRGKGHLSWTHYAKDCEKYTWAAILGWVVVRITASMIQDGRAGPLIRTAINVAINPSLAEPYRRRWPPQAPKVRKTARRPRKKT